MLHGELSYRLQLGIAILFLPQDVAFASRLAVRGYKSYSLR